MTNCECPHEPIEHAPVQDFGISMCLVSGCNCDGTREQVAAMLADRIARSADSKLERLVRLIV